MSELLNRRCSPGTPRLPGEEVARLLAQVPGYEADSAGLAISKQYEFENFYQTMAFVNAVAYIAHVEDHHPDLAVSYKRCRVTFSTHDAGGLSANDFICAAKVDALLSR